ncbi:MAG: hypothetical protein HY370_04045 [Proteobacteria bacterium]|nr:hypothetical protein [Pseudomonadota bacterium]
MSDNNKIDIKTLMLIQKATAANASLVKRLEQSEALHREKDEIILWMSGGYSLEGKVEKDTR